jgi:multidrug efflux pump subunit AcrA (membrane-fusion protein)
MLENLNSNDLPVVHSNDFLPPINSWTTFGGLLLVSSVISALTLSAFVKYNVVVKAPASVRPSGGTRMVQSTVAGTVKQIKVVDNQFVQKDQVIATLDNTQLLVRKRELQDTLEKDQEQLNQVKGQIKLQQSRIKAETDLNQKTIFSAESELSLSQKQLQEQQAISQAEIQDARASLTLAKARRDRYQKLEKSGAISTLEIEEQEKSFTTALAQLEKAKVKSTPSIAITQIAKAKIAQERSRGDSSLATLNQSQSELIHRQIEIQNQIDSSYRELEQLSSKFKETIIQASATGDIFNLSLKNSGQFVNTGELIAQISPSKAPLLVKAYVEAKDISKVQVCQMSRVIECQQGKVKMRISAYPYPDYGILNGAVRAISADVVTPPSEQPSRYDVMKISNTALSYYEVTIQPEKNYLEREKTLYYLKSGLEVNAEIIYKEQSLLAFILTKLKLFTDLSTL